MDEPLKRGIVRNWYPNMCVLCVLCLVMALIPGSYLKTFFVSLVVCGGLLVSLFYAFKLPSASTKFNSQLLQSSIFGHRGALHQDNIDPNTISAFQFAYDCNATGIECDVRFTKDNIPIIAHDYHVRGLAHSDAQNALHSIHFHELTLEEIKKIRLKHNNESEFMTLEELIQFMNAHTFRKTNRNEYFCLLLEIKHRVYGKYNDQMLRNILQCLHKMKYKNERVVFISFSISIVYRLKRMDKYINVGIIFERCMWFCWITKDGRPTVFMHRVLYPFVDPIHTFCCRWIVPQLCGCCCIMTHYSLLSAHIIQHYVDHGVSVCCWGSSGIDTSWLLSKGVCCVVDNPNIN